MSEWWTYRPHDFLMFSPRIYWRLFEAVNQAWWPLQPALLAAALATAAVLLRPRPMALRPVWATLAAGWGLVAWDFLQQRFTPISGPASAAVWLWALQALALAAAAAAGGLGLHTALWRRRAGAALVLWAAVVHPVLAALSGRPAGQAEFFGLAPDPTAIATLGVLLATGAERAWARPLQAGLWLLPLAWCGASGAMLATMGSWQALVPWSAGALALWAAHWCAEQS